MTFIRAVTVYYYNNGKQTSCEENRGLYKDIHEQLFVRTNNKSRKLQIVKGVVRQQALQGGFVKIFE